MRIISGIHKGRIVKFPKSDLVRPTTDKVKESLFNYLCNFLDFDGISICDVYAGSGSLGLEAISRGAGRADFVEKDFKVSNILKENIDSLGEKDKCRILRMEAVKFSKLVSHEKYDLILADPPFFKNDIHAVVKNLVSNGFLNDEGMIIVERSVQTRKEDEENFEMEAFKKIGDSLIYRFEQNDFPNKD